MNATEQVESVGQRVRRLRRERGLSQQDLAIEGIAHHSYISHIESGQRHPSLAVLLALADRLNVSALYIMTGQDENCPFCGKEEESS